MFNFNFLFNLIDCYSNLLKYLNYYIEYYLLLQFQNVNLNNFCFTFHLKHNHLFLTKLLIQINLELNQLNRVFNIYHLL